MANIKVIKMEQQDLKYKGQGGDEGLKRFKSDTKKAETQMLSIVDYVIRNKDIISEFDKMSIVSFFETQIIRLHSEDITGFKNCD